MWVIGEMSREAIVSTFLMQIEENQSSSCFNKMKMSFSFMEIVSNLVLIG